MAKTLGLALGSGSDRGFAHIGVLKALAEAEVKINFLSGSSMGAVVGAYYALHQETDKLEKIALNIAPAEWWKLVDVNLPSISLIKGEKLRQFLIDNLYGLATFEDLKIPLRVVATTLEEGKPYIINSGLVVDAVLASSTLPGIFPPKEMGGRHLIDGGLSEAVPLDELDWFGADIRIGVDLYSYTLESEEKYEMKEVLMRAYRLYMARLSQLEKYHNDVRTVILRPQTNEGLETLTFTHARPNILAGYLATTTSMTLIKQLVMVV
jgi:NTE family protein